MRWTNRKWSQQSSEFFGELIQLIQLALRTLQRAVQMVEPLNRGRRKKRSKAEVNRFPGSRPRRAACSCVSAQSGSTDPNAGPKSGPGWFFFLYGGAGLRRSGLELQFQLAMFGLSFGLVSVPGIRGSRTGLIPESHLS